MKRINLKRTLTLLLVGLMLIGMTACSSSQTSTKDKKTDPTSGTPDVYKRQAIFFVTTFFKTLVNGLSARLGLQIWAALPPLLMSTVLGSVIGFRLFASMDMRAVKHAVNVLMVAVGIYYTFS